MRVFLAPASAPVPPLDAPARDALVLDRTLGETMARELAAAGLDVVPVPSLGDGEERARREPDGGFVLLDSVIASRTAIRRFVGAARRASGGAFALALPGALLTDGLAPLDGLDAREVPNGRPVWTVPFFFLRGASASIAGAEPLVLPFKELVLRFPIPRAILGRTEQTVGISETYACNVSHWVHVLRLNQVAIAGWWFDRVRWGVLLGALWMAWRVLCGFPWFGGRVLAGLRSTSMGAKVHYKAHLELSVVKKGAVVGAYACIKNSFIAEGAMIGEGARVFGSVIGKGGFVAAGSTVFGSVVYPGAFASQVLMQVSILGQDSCALITSNFFDVNFSRNVRVFHRGRYVDSGAQFLGVCVGPEARIGGGVWVASGREIPRGALVVKPAGPIVAKVGALEPGVPYASRDGVLVRVGPEGS
jgi:acetyltransferase-like isoleucine patch superfamily enzyme